MEEPGLELHEWQARWEQLREVAEESPADAAPEMGRLLEEMLTERGMLESDGEATKLLAAGREAQRGRASAPPSGARARARARRPCPPAVQEQRGCAR